MVVKLFQFTLLNKPLRAVGFVCPTWVGPATVAVYAPPETSEVKEKEMFYAKLDSIVDQCPSRDTLVLLGDFNVVT